MTAGQTPAVHIKGGTKAVPWVLCSTYARPCFLEAHRRTLCVLFLLVQVLNHSHLLPNAVYVHLLTRILDIGLQPCRSTTVQVQMKGLTVRSRASGKRLGVLI